MRLKSLKLAGFKSFVDPIQIEFPGIMCGIVGPNGCGKSNIIDAIKWVKGELSAKSLRSESLQDVIFNGSDNRKPVSHCSVELVFDNSENFLGGEYLKFEEVSVKREMGRDGQSTYFINNAVARRRDVQDLFLGTGLGSNSYAIIEQGIISSLVGAKPEELRSYVEEAAGITKYKERKRETESRIRRTAENIARLKDLEDEVKRSIRRLNAEANLTTKYKKLREQEQQFQKFLISAELKELEERKKASEKENKSIDTDIEGIDAKRISVISKRDVAKTKLMEGLKILEDEQRKFFETGAKISLVEEKDKSIKNKIDDLNLEKDKIIKNLSNLKDSEKSESENKTDVPKDYEGDLKLKVQNEVSNLKIKSEEVKKEVGQSLGNFWKDGYKFGLGQASESTETLSVLKKQFEERLVSIESEIIKITNENESEKSGLADLVQARKDLELKVIDHRAQQDKSNEELRNLEGEISKLETQKDTIIQDRNEKELNKRSIEIEVNEKVDRLKTFSEVKDIEGEVIDITQSLEKLQNKIMNLGPINFAAPETLEAEKKRKETLSEQINELETSLSKLDEAIKKIDKESNKTFHECLNSVNKFLEEMFPKLFGGGFSKLNLLDDSEDSGLVLMARLPGKKNTKLSQLSGGEKALTALALVFSLFSINPAPFCLLDEVDAPLDDDNTLRFINLVSEMSAKVQFIFVTHNKISMEKSSHLLGVTMRDLGVSKVVSVDVEQAMELAQS
ncbi:MAG: AAA family ATPase [Pseudomonadota bacterium]|jgi:chromosome segregation ATPase|nr:AAA family ATPase [Pseudomonadota bacterium]